ncbi:MAG: type II restriction endonuclease [Bifidobacterium psychraerophilum]|uniref:type II restriction endonuclease n=1 Tax=Bifidobacterium psychraerophilum TaxID=218140 RepID=UPI0039ECA42C
MGNYGNIGDYIGVVAAKRLSAVDIDPKSSHQHEFGDRSGALRKVLGDNDRKGSNNNGIPTVIMYLDDDEPPIVADIDTTWYDTRRNQSNRSPEWRLYYKDCDPIRHAKPGDLMCFGMLTDGRLLILITRQESSMETQTEWLFNIQDESERSYEVHDVTGYSVDTFAATILEALGIIVEAKDDTLLDEMISKWGYSFPSNADFAVFAQESLKDVDPAHDDPDKVVLAYYDQNFLLFKVFEKAVIQHEFDLAPFVLNDEIDVEAFTTFYTRVRNRRMSRAGTSLELHIARILDERGIKYKAQGHTEDGKKPDFLFPSQEAYDDRDFPEAQLRMLASKTSLKDRFRQVADEACRIHDKHLFTITPGDVTHLKLRQMDELHIHLVMPEKVKGTYDRMIQSSTMNFSDFINEMSSFDRSLSTTSGSMFRYSQPSREWKATH